MTTRRHLLQVAGAATAAANMQAQEKQAQEKKRSANDKIQIALIGAGGMGSGDANSSREAGGKIVACADIYQGRLDAAKERWGDVFVTRDYRDLLARPDVDAVIIGTPDHWHYQIASDAMKAGKDVYVEKPMVQKIEHGLPLIETAKQTGRILQVGSQRVSSMVYAKARDLIRAGAIGQVNFIEAWWDRNSAIGAWQYSVPPSANTQNIDWDRFLGSAPKVAFDPIRLFRWRNYRDYGTGVAGDLFVHLFSGMHFIMDVPGPTRVHATGGLRYWNDGRDVPDVFLGLYDYPKTEQNPAFNMALRVNFVNGSGENSGFRFVGSEGVLTLEGGITVAKQPREKEPGYTRGFSRSVDDEIVAAYRGKYPETRNAGMEANVLEKYSAPRGYSDHLDHHKNFLDCVRNKKQPVEDAAFGFRAAGPALLSNMSYFQQQTMRWDPVAMKVVSSS
jgi:predicted dehydrogenase